MKKHALSETMNNGMNPIRVDAGAEHVWVPALSVEQIDNPMHTTQPEDRRADCDGDADVMMTIDKGKIRVWFVRKLIAFTWKHSSKIPNPNRKSPPRHAPARQ